jgi:hypothetical protein
MLAYWQGSGWLLPEGGEGDKVCCLSPIAQMHHQILYIRQGIANVAALGYCMIGGALHMLVLYCTLAPQGRGLHQEWSILVITATCG